jgi:hypothetical protein
MSPILGNLPGRADEYVVVLEGDFLVSPGAGGPTIAINSDPSPAKYLTEVFNQSGALVAFGHGPALPILPQSELPAAGTQTAALNDPPAPLSTPPSSGIGPGWTTPPTRIATSAP